MFYKNSVYGEQLHWIGLDAVGLTVQSYVDGIWVWQELTDTN